MGSRYDVFISHSSANKNWVVTLASNLKAQGIRVFLDIWELKAGGRLLLDLQSALECSLAAILVVTPDAARSGWVQDEYDSLMERRRRDESFRLIPLNLGGAKEFPFLHNILAIDFCDITTYRRSFHELLSALRDEPPGDSTFDGPLEIPSGSINDSLADCATAFLDDLFLQIDQDRLSLLLAQEGMLLGPVTNQILTYAQRYFDPNRVIHVVPPVITDGHEAAYFGSVAEQFGAGPGKANAETVRRYLRGKLSGGGRLCLILTGFENGTNAARRGLAATLRSLIDQYPGQLRILLQGGEKLADLRDAQGELSLLSRAQIHHWPELTQSDVRTLYEQRFHDDLPALEADTILRATGAEPRLVRSCMILRRSHPSIDVEEYEAELLDGEDETLWQLLSPFVRDRVTAALLLESTTQGEVGKGRGWITNPFHRRLYWRNLLTRRRRRLMWRCEVLREAAGELAACILDRTSEFGNPQAIDTT